MATKILRDPFPAVRHLDLHGLGLSGAALAHLLDAQGRTSRASDERPSTAPLPPSCTFTSGPLHPPEGQLRVLAPSLNPEWPENRARPDLHALTLAPPPTIAEVDYAAACWPGPLLAVGGTDGKSTTVSLAHHLLASLGLPTALGGNSWTPLSTRVLELDRAGDPTAVLCAEVSAFQSWQPLHMRPHAAILTNIAGDHLDHYASFEQYARAKIRLLDALEPGRLAVLYAPDPRLVAAAHDLVQRGVRVVLYSEDPAHLDHAPPHLDAAHATCDANDFLVPYPGASPLRLPLDALRLPGAHNRRNALAALTAVADLAARSPHPPAPDVLAERFAHGLTTFTGLAHRLEWVARIDGVDFFDDSKATNVHAAITGLRSCGPGTITITGGVDKDLPLAPWVDALADCAPAVLLLGALGQRLAPLLTERGIRFESTPSLTEAVPRAHALARELLAPRVLLGPAASSFDQYAGFEARGQDFQRQVRALAVRR
jgi:UDP-N-acetylmuramoylalanine--D-glutamate ligase